MLRGSRFVDGSQPSGATSRMGRRVAAAAIFIDTRISPVEKFTRLWVWPHSTCRRRFIYRAAATTGVSHFAGVIVSRRSTFIMPVAQSRMISSLSPCRAFHTTASIGILFRRWRRHAHISRRAGSSWGFQPIRLPASHSYFTYIYFGLDWDYRYWVRLRLICRVHAT